MSTEQVFNLVVFNPNKTHEELCDLIPDSETTKWSNKCDRLYWFLNEMTAAGRIKFVNGVYTKS